MVVEITKAQLLTYHLGKLLDQNKAKHTQISTAQQCTEGEVRGWPGYPAAGDSRRSS
jgi:hypothetical protein